MCLKSIRKGLMMTMKVTKEIADYFLESLADLYLFRDSQGRLYAKFQRNNCFEIWSLDSEAIDYYLIERYMQKFDNTIPNDSTIAKVKKVLNVKASISKYKHNVYARVANFNDVIYIDLCNERWEVIEITKKGWRVISDAPVFFTRSRIMKELPVPEKNGHIESLRPFINVKKEDDLNLIIAWLLSTLKGNNAHPILMIYGEQGSAKSTATSILRSIIDPSYLSLRSLVKDEKDIAIMTRNTFVLAFDNLSILSNEMSDVFCKISTGGAFSTRTLFTTFNESYIKVNRPIIANGIENLAERPDLLDRSIIINLDVIDEKGRKTNQEIWGEFDARHSEILGAICNIASAALEEFTSINLNEKPRMADFSKWVTAAESFLEWEPDYFLEIYNDNRRIAVEQGLETSPLALAVINMIEVEHDVADTMKDILTKLKKYGDNNSYSLNNIYLNKLKGMLKRLAPLLREYSIFIEELPRSNKGSRLRIYREKT